MISVYVRNGQIKKKLLLGGVKVDVVGNSLVLELNKDVKFWTILC